MTTPPFILALGDSLVAGYGLATADGFPAQLEAALQVRFSGAHVLNAGVSGSTTADVERRLPGILSGLTRRPDLAIVQVGPNDVLRQVPATRTRAHLAQTLLRLQDCGIPVLLTTVAPPAILRDRAAAYLGIHAELAADYGATVRPFFPPGVLGHPDMVLADKVHPNAKAIAAVVAALRDAVEAML